MPARRWIARLRKALAMLAVTLILSACGEKAPQPSALELLQAGERPYETWRLEPASTDALVSALADCVKVAERDADLDLSSELLEEAGWQRRDYPDDLVSLVQTASEEPVQAGTRNEEFQRYSPIIQSDQWPIVFENDASVTLLALREGRQGIICSVLANTPEEDFEAISRAVAVLDQSLEPRIETPHGFGWRNGQVIVTEDYGDGWGGRWEFVPPVFASYYSSPDGIPMDVPPGIPTANLSVVNCNGITKCPSS